MRRLLRYHSNQPGPVQVVAAQFATNAGGVYYPMEWEPDNHGVPGVDRSEQYVKWCNSCK